MRRGAIAKVSGSKKGTRAKASYNRLQELHTVSMEPIDVSYSVPMIFQLSLAFVDMHGCIRAMTEVRARVMSYSGIRAHVHEATRATSVPSRSAPPPCLIP